MARVVGTTPISSPSGALLQTMRTTDLMAPAHMPPPSADVSWKERSWKRELKPDRLKVLWARAGRTMAHEVSDIPVVRLTSREPVPVTIPLCSRERSSILPICTA